MRNHFTLLCAMIVLWLLPSCSNDVVNGVFVPEKQSVEREKSVLTLTLKNLQISEGMVIGILDKSLLMSTVVSLLFPSLIFGSATD